MGLSENSDDHIFKRHQELCNNLNMDSATTAQAWDSYESIRQHYTLEGDPVHWLGCAIYVACRKSTTPTVGHTDTGSVVKGNCVSLTRLLRLCNFSLTQFFNKTKKWADMANMPTEFRKRIDDLERNFAVSCVVFKKFHVIFNEMFLAPVDDQPKQHRSRKQRNLPCTSARVFEFCWTLFVCIKGEFATCSDDLVTSFHLLLACCDMAFSNALLSDRRDLLNPSFSGLPPNWCSADYVKPTNAPCIIDNLCDQFDGIRLEAKWVKEYSWKEAVTKLFDKGILHGEVKNFTGLFEPVNFDNNVKAVNKVYEEHVLNVGEFDEKIFLAEYRRTQLLRQASAGPRPALRDLNTPADGDLNTTIGSPNRVSGSEEKSQIKRSLASQYDDQIQQLHPATPLTGRKYLLGKDIQRNAPLTTATQSVIRLQTLLSGRQPEPSAQLTHIFSSCSRDPTEAIQSRVTDMGAMFRRQYVQQTAEHSNTNMDFANKRLTLSETLYYKLLENVVQEERLRNPNLDVTVLLEQDIFHRCMFACSIEIVIYSYNSQRKFPWILKALDLKAYYFYRVIELIVRTKDQLSRDVVKHLNSIEEQILESIAWESDSPLWQCIEASGRAVPSCEDTARPPTLAPTPTPTTTNTRRIHTATGAVQSPVSTAAEIFQSPIASSLVKKKLFVDSQSKMKPGQSLLQNSTQSKMAVVIVDNEGNQRLIPISDVVSANHPQPAPPPPPQVDPPKPKRNGSLALFFRKFYNLSGVRMEELCNQLNVTDTELKRKIFTCFEHTIIENSDLMKDRHLDQMLMCAVYVVCKVSRNEKSFTEIMRCYRLQPQADSHVYRSVLVHKRANGERNVGNTDKHVEVNTATNTKPKLANPGELTGTHTSHDLEDRGDLILFYNTVYIQRIQSFALRFSTSQQTENLQLSPLPVTKHLPLTSPKRRVIENFFVRPYDQILSSPNTTKQYSYYFSRSPSKDLKNINMVINTRVGKRLLSGDVDDDVTAVSPLKKAASAAAPPPPAMTRKLQGLIEERLGHNNE